MSRSHCDKLHRFESEATAEAVGVIESAYLSAVSDVIECYGGSIPQVIPSERSSGAVIGAVVGFADPRVKGSSVLVAAPAAVARLAPLTDADPRDWLGELNNQIVGRFKNRLVPYGVMLQLSTPVTTDGVGLRFGAVQARITSWVIQVPEGPFRVLLALTLPADLVLTHDGTAVVAEEGSLSLF